MMPNQILPQPIADPPPGPGARPAIISTTFSRPEPCIRVRAQRAERSRAASGHALFQAGRANRSCGYGRSRRQPSRNGAQ